MKKLLLLFVIMTGASCQQQMEPTVENINQIFQTYDFQIKFHINNGQEYRMGFLNNEIAYFSPQETVRRELSYDDVRLINTFVQYRFRESGTAPTTPHKIEIYNDSKSVAFNTMNYQKDFEQLLNKLNLPYVPTTQK